MHDPVRHLPLVNDGNPLVNDGGSASPDAAALLRVGDLAKATGKTVRAIHHYEKLGLLSPSRRSKGRYRLYAQDAIDRVRWIHKLSDIGMTLGQIQQILATWEDAASAPRAMAKIREVYRQKLEEVRAQAARLQALEIELSKSLAYLETCDSVCRPTELVETCSECTIHPGDQPQLITLSLIHI